MMFLFKSEKQTKTVLHLLSPRYLIHGILYLSQQVLGRTSASSEELPGKTLSKKKKKAIARRWGQQQRGADRRQNWFQPFLLVVFILSSQKQWLNVILY